MSANSIPTPSNTPKPGFPPGPSEAQQQAGVFKGATRTVVLDGSRLHKVHDGVQWWIVKVEAAN